MIIANPVAQSGAADRIARQFTAAVCANSTEDECEMILTEYAGHAIELVKAIPDTYDTLIAIGGDGLIHEVVNGLMAIPSESRPTLAVVPVGSGNDYAKTLGMSKKPEKAIKQIQEYKVQMLDIGMVNGQYFDETLSFGLDAAIAIDTMERRKRTGDHGVKLYMQSGIDQILHHLDEQNYNAVLMTDKDGRKEELHLKGQSYLFAVQIGKTYGGGFKICPKADPQDGLFDVCIVHPPFNAARALGVFMLAKSGLHTRFKRFEFHRCSSLSLKFAEPPAAQTDGEKIEGSTFDIKILPRELSVVVGDYQDVD